MKIGHPGMAKRWHLYFDGSCRRGSSRLVPTCGTIGKVERIRLEGQALTNRFARTDRHHAVAEGWSKTGGILGTPSDLRPRSLKRTGARNRLGLDAAPE